MNFRGSRSDSSDLKIPRRTKSTYTNLYAYCAQRMDWDVEAWSRHFCCFHNSPRARVAAPVREVSARAKPEEDKKDKKKN